MIHPPARKDTQWEAIHRTALPGDFSMALRSYRVAARKLADSLAGFLLAKRNRDYPHNPQITPRMISYLQKIDPSAH